MVKDINYYMSLPYTLILSDDGEGGWFIQVAELKGCMSGGATKIEALNNIEDSKYSWIEMSLEHNSPIPEPAPVLT
jgi:predicted RNase H-like HicB family nuclease